MASLDIWPIIIAWGEGRPPAQEDRQAIVDWELSKLKNRQTWPSNPDHVPASLEARAQILQLLHNSGLDLPLPGSWQQYIELLWTFWIPFAQQLSAAQKALDRPFIQGVLGGQGTGKTTLTQILTLILGQMGQRCAALSLDDLYLTYEERLKVQQLDPRLVWRGPPGTHNLQLGIDTLSALKTAAPGSQVSLPRFDKSLHQGEGDRTQPIHLSAPTIVLFEGWFVGAVPLDDALFADKRIDLPSPIDTPEDRQFARDMNRQLRQYLPLWDLLDNLAVLALEDYRLSYEWRLQAEQQMRANGKDGLSDEAIARFVTYFWRALHPELYVSPFTETATASNADRRKADIFIKIGQGHMVKMLYSP